MSQVKKNCKFCKKYFYTTTNLVKEGRGINCSKECQSMSARKGENKTCEICTNEFYVNPSTVKNKKCRFCSPQCNGIYKQQHNLFKGESNPRWKGGITGKNAGIRSSAEYKKWREDVFARDNYKCVWCGDKNGEGKAVVFHADHIKPFAYFPDLRFEVSNGRTLCTTCHRYTASYMGRSRRYFEANNKPFIPGKTRIEYGGIVLGPEEHDAIFQSIFSSGMKRWTVGPECEAMEKELAEVAGVSNVVLVNSGSSALLLSIAAMKLPKRTKIIIPAVNFPTAFNAIIQNGHIPVVVDVDIKTLNISLDEVKKALEKHPDVKVVIAVHIAGSPVDLISLREIVGTRKIISDNCDSFGGTLKGQMLEKYADVSCASFHAAHIIGMGEGGGLFTNDKALGVAALKMREWGRASGTDDIYEYPGFPDDYKERYVYEEIGYNLKPLDLQAAMGRIQLKKLHTFKKARLKNYNALSDLFSKYLSHFEIIKCSLDADPCWFSFPLLVKNNRRGEIMRILDKENNIECRTIFSGNIIKHPAYKDTEMIVVGEMTNADRVMKDGMFLSVHPSITPEMIAFIDQVIGELCT